MLLFGGFILVPLAKLTHSISLLLYWYLPYKLAKFYTEYEPHGKKMHVFIGDYLIYFWDFKLNHVYTIALLNFNMYEDAFDKEKIRHHVQLCNTATHKISYDKQEFIYVVLAKFNKTLGELETLYEKWLYALKNLYKLTQRPKELCDKVFDRLFEEAEIAKFTPQEIREYEASKKAYRDIKNSIDTAKQEGLAEGMELGMNQKALDIARNMLADGVDINLIMKYSGLTQEQIENLK